MYARLVSEPGVKILIVKRNSASFEAESLSAYTNMRLKVDLDFHE